MRESAAHYTKLILCSILSRVYPIWKRSFWTIFISVKKSTGCMTRSWFFLYHSHDSYPKQSNEACPSDSEFCNICNILLYNQHFITDRWKFEKRQQATLNLNGKILTWIIDKYMFHSSLIPSPILRERWVEWAISSSFPLFLVSYLSRSHPIHGETGLWKV